MNDIETAKKLFFEGLDFFDAGDLVNAESKLREALRLAPQNNAVMTNLAVVLAKQNKFAEARVHAQRAVSDNDSNVEALRVLDATSPMLTNAQVSSGADDDIETAKKLFFEGLEFFNAGDLANAEPKLREALRLAPQNNAALTNLAVVLARQDKFAEAQVYARKAVADDDSNIEALRILSACCLKDSDPQFDEILRINDRIIQLAPNDGSAHNNRGLALVHGGRFTEALESYDRAIALNPANAHYLTNRGNVLFELKQYSQALATHDKALALNPGMLPEGWLGRGNVLFELHRDAEALVCFEKAVAAKPDLAAGWLAIGKLHQRSNERDLAIAAFKKANEAAPKERYDAKLYLMQMGAEELSDMSPAFVRSLFDQYAPQFEKELVGKLNYRGPQLLLKAVLDACRKAGHPASFARGIDLGCGTGLAAREFAPHVKEFIGVDLSPGMIERARQSGHYARLDVADMVQGLANEPDASADLVIAADAMIYLLDLTPVAVGAARVLNSGGVFAFTTETHDGNGVVLGLGLRYAHGTDHVRTAIAQAGLQLVDLSSMSVRNEKNVAVPGLVVVARKM
ncbi:MAG: tetratricopeptide repeat protein [Bradyrhizobiaceae bacterium]|nr:MAG: tetratricopeptide repeat protein [Bradyrhizobiaceae bacterium]